MVYMFKYVIAYYFGLYKIKYISQYIKIITLMKEIVLIIGKAANF